MLIVWIILGIVIGYFLGKWRGVDIKYDYTEKTVEQVNKPKKAYKNKEYEDSARIESYEDLAYFAGIRIKSEYLKPKKDIEDKRHKFYGKKLVITGVFHDFYDRNILAEKIWSVGGDIDTSVTEKTNYLIVGENAGPSKMDKALEYGAEIIYEEELVSYFEDYDNFIDRGI